MPEDRICGDGFVDHDSRDLPRVRDWSLVTTDELSDGRAHAPVAELVATQAEAIDASLRETIGALSVDWLGSGESRGGDRAQRRTARRVRPPPSSCAASSRASRPADMARFAYLTGVDPAYVWPQGATLAAWGATAAWLGALAHRGAAYIPVEVAEYISDVAPLDPDGVTSIRDPLIGDRVRRCADPAELLRAVRRRYDELSIVVRRRLPEQLENRLLGSLRRSLRRALLARGPTAAAGKSAP